VTRIICTVQWQFRGMSRRAGIYQELEEQLRNELCGSDQEAVAVIGRRLPDKAASDTAGGVGGKST
jgi:hypothetical protein